MFLRRWARVRIRHKASPKPGLRRRRLHGAALCLGAALSALPVTQTQAQTLFSFTHPAMGTTYTLFLYAGSAPLAGQEAEKVFAEIDDVEALLSNYQPHSELSRINTLAARETVTTDPETLDFLQRSLAWSARSDGAFDITVGALMKSWGFFRGTGHVPSAGELDAVREKTGWTKVSLSQQARTVRFASDGLELDPGGIGKGYAVDRAVRLLRNDGVQAALLSAGSSTIYGLGTPPGKRGWRVKVPDPVRPHGTVARVLLRNTSLSTASCAEKHFVFAGRLYCHIMDPRLLRPVEQRLQATVIAPSATDSDALSNVVFVDNDGERAAFMRTAGPGVRALVINGVPGTDAAQNQEQGCRTYNWPSPVQHSCTRQVQAAHTQGGS